MRWGVNQCQCNFQLLRVSIVFYFGHAYSEDTIPQKRGICGTASYCFNALVIIMMYVVYGLPVVNWSVDSACANKALSHNV